MDPKWVASLRAELHAMVIKAIEESPYGFIVAIEADEEGNDEQQQTDHPWTGSDDAIQ
jgi:hypothetical protein